MSEIEELLKPFISRQFGPDVEDKEARLAAFKRLVPGILPADYEEFLSRFERCVDLEENHIWAIDPPRPRQEGVFTYIGPNPPIEILYGLQEDHYDVFRALRWYSNQIPPGLIAIGEDLMGNQICMDISGRGPNTIWHWFHEGEESFDENGAPGYANMFRLAWNFTDLLRRLRHGGYQDPAAVKPRELQPGEAKICYIAPGVEEEIRNWREKYEREAESNKE